MYTRYTETLIRFEDWSLVLTILIQWSTSTNPLRSISTIEIVSNDISDAILVAEYEDCSQFMNDSLTLRSEYGQVNTSKAEESTEDEFNQKYEAFQDILTDALNKESDDYKLGRFAGNFEVDEDEDGYNESYSWYYKSLDKSYYYPQLTVCNVPTITIIRSGFLDKYYKAIGLSVKYDIGFDFNSNGSGYYVDKITNKEFNDKINSII